MALSKNIALPFNVSAEYHRIGGLFILDSERIMEIHLQSFKDKATRDATKEVPADAGVDLPPRIVEQFTPMAAPVVKVSGKEFDVLFGPGTPEYPTKADLYSFLKESNQSVFKDATDI